MATQQERRDSAIARLLDASIATIVELGYAKASASAITKRAGLSHGALFRHFESMSDFMAATAREALRRQMGDFRSRVTAAGPALEVGGVLQIMREVMGSRTNAVIYELTNAARTDKELQRILQAGSAAYTVTVRDVARTLPGMAHFPDELFTTLVLMLTDVFDAEAVLRPTRPLPTDELARRDEVITLMYTWASSLGGSANPTQENR